MGQGENFGISLELEFPSNYLLLFVLDKRYMVFDIRNRSEYFLEWLRTALKKYTYIKYINVNKFFQYKILNLTKE